MRRSGPLRRKPLQRGTLSRSSRPIRSRNPERREKRRRKYSARLKRKDWAVKRDETFERDGWRCVRVVDGVRCPNGRANDAPLHCNHRTYARFGHELPEDLETLCESCDEIVTSETRANWM